MKYLNDRARLEQLAHECHYSVESLAEVIGLNPRQFRYLFEKEYGISPKSWLIECRSRRAINMIQCGNKTAEICEELGYSNPGHLRTEIKSVTGVTPKQLDLMMKMNAARMHKK